VGEREFTGRPSRDQVRLVVAAFAGSVRVDGDVCDEIRADADGCPPASDRSPERIGEALLAAVLDGVQRVTDDPAELGAPLELQERLGQLGGQADRDAACPGEPGVERRSASVADRRALHPAADTGCR
jgi:hypothetical protein